MSQFIKKGDIILVDLNPIKGSETGKIKPCIVVTNNTYNQRLPVIQVVPITNWSEKKSIIITNITISPTNTNGLSKKSIADCLQTRPIDYLKRMEKVDGKVDRKIIDEIDNALKIVFGLEQKN